MMNTGNYTRDNVSPGKTPLDSNKTPKDIFDMKAYDTMKDNIADLRSVSDN